MAGLGRCDPLIISGAPRSGTSLIYNLFDGHSQVNWLVDEGYLFEYLADMGPDGVDIFMDAIPSDLAAFVAGIRDKQVMPPVERSYRQSRERGSVSDVEIAANWDEDRFLASLAHFSTTDIASLWSQLVRSYLVGMHQVEKRYCCLKAPDFGKSAESALWVTPEARTIIIVRDPVASLDSLKRSRELRGDKLLSWPLLAQNIRNFQRLSKRIEAADRDRTYVLRYETLVAQPEQTMRSISEWLKIRFEPCLLQPTMRGKHWPGISSFAPTDRIESAAANRVVQALDLAEVALIKKHLAAFRDCFNYT